MNIALLVIYHGLVRTTNTKARRGDFLNTQAIHKQKGKINIIFNERHQAKSEKQNVDYLNNNKHLKVIDEQFSSFVGLAYFKNIIKEIYATRLLNERRSQV